MLLSNIHANPERYQFREAEFSERTVNAIVDEGIDTAKFDPIPVMKSGKRFVVAGDGHSRLESCRRLAESKRLPREWKSGDDWEIPTRIVKRTDALRLAQTGNLSRDPFTAVEKARIFKARLDAGDSVEQVAQSSHTTTTYIERCIAVLDLAKPIQDAIEVDGGISVATARALAVGFKRHGITPDQQRQLWDSALRDARLNPTMARKIVESIGRRMTGSTGDNGFMFDMPENAAAVVSDLQRELTALRDAKQAIRKLLDVADTGVLDEFDALANWLAVYGNGAIERIDERISESNVFSDKGVQSCNT